MPSNTLRLVSPLDCNLHMLGMNQHATAKICGYSISSDRGIFKVKGTVETLELGHGRELDHIIFHVSKFTHYDGQSVRDKQGTQQWLSRAAIEVGEWRITLDKFKPDDRLFNEMSNTGGFAVTHVGKLERLDGKAFAAKKSEKMFDALPRYLSFCRGAWVALILPVGFDKSGGRVWEKWEAQKIVGWRPVNTWFGGHSEESLAKGFPGFYARWQEEKWQEPLELANHWYVEANMAAGGVEGSIILAQAGLELLGWCRLVGEKLGLSEKGYENIAAMEKLRLLLMVCGIPSAIPASLSKLTAVAKAKENQWKDGPQAVIEVRNALVHSNPAKRRKVFDEERALVREV